MIRYLATLLALSTLLWSSAAVLLEHDQHGASVALASTTCIVDHDATHDLRQDEGRPVAQPSGDRHNHVCVACHSTRMRATTAASPDLLSAEALSFSLDRQHRESLGASYLLATQSPRGPPLS